MMWSELKTKIEAALQEAGMTDVEVGTIDVGLQDVDSIRVTLENMTGDPLLTVY